MEVEIQNTTNKQQMAGKMQINTENTEVLKGSYNNYSGKVQILTNLLQITRPSLWM